MSTLAPLLPLLLLMTSNACRSLPDPPVADRRPHELIAHGDRRVDEYYWLNQREDSQVIAYLEQENEYTQAVMAPTRALRDELYTELKGRIKEDDSTVPARQGTFLYYTRFEEGKPYPIHCRTDVASEREQVLLDVNEMAEGHGYFAVGGRAVSPDGNRLAYGTDTRGRRIYDLAVKDLTTGAISDRIEDVTSNMAWAEDGETLFYARQDPETLRSYQIWRHRMGTERDADVLVYEETDETFRCWVTKSRSRKYLMIGSSQTVADEVRILEADQPDGDFRVFLPRERGHEYDIDHHGEHFYVRTNRGGDETSGASAKNFRLMRVPVSAIGSGVSAWEEVVPHREDIYLADFDLFQNHLVLSERREGLVHLAVRDFRSGEQHDIPFDEAAWSARATSNPEFDTEVLRFAYSSMTTPSSIYDYDMGTRARDLRKRQEVLGGFDPDDYRTARLFATARDGTRVPISLVHRADTPPNGSNPLLLYGYGSYGASMDASFSPDRLSLLDRGFVFAIAHVRGGQELGRDWYEGGKLLHKKNTFTDFIDCGEHLVAEGWTSPAHLYAMGGSAGGLLVGAVVNMRPDLFRGVVAAVPFVDVVTTMLDDTIPLTTFEYDEWGNPNERESYDYMLSYSPYDQVSAQDYPALLVTTGLHDSQVQYWEPAKWVAKLRATSTSDAALLLKTNMEAGHGGASGRYKRYEERAFEYAFLLALEQGLLEDG